MSHVRLALLVFAAGLSSGASATDWWLIGSNDQGALYLDRSSLKRSGDIAVQHLMVVQPRSPIRRIEVTERIDCKKATAVDVRQVFILVNGKRFDRPVQVQQRSPRPGTNGWASYRFACGSDAERRTLGTPVPQVDIEQIAQAVIAPSR